MPSFDGAAGPAYYREWLVPRPRATVIFAHGVGEHAGLYDRYAGHLGGHGISLRALDQIGHGRSAGSPGTGRWGVITSADDLVADIGQLADLAAAADPGVPLILQGHSLGAIMGAVAATRHPDRYAAVVLSGSKLTEPPGFRTDTGDIELAGSLSADPGYLRWLAEDPLVFTGGPQMTASLRRVLPPAWAELVVALPGLDKPVLLVHGEDDLVSPVSGARYWAAVLPHARLAIFPGARHDVLNETVHEQVAAVIAQFIGGVTGQAGPAPGGDQP
ncbi:MAG TPA: alpha/beta fold hydrolase [Streptosporangiaceae bacterium]